MRPPLHRQYSQRFATSMRCSRETFVTFRCRRGDERAQALPQSRPIVKGPVECMRPGGLCEDPSDLGDECRRAELERRISRAAILANVRRNIAAAAP
jgi:hypothetical protein